MRICVTGASGFLGNAIVPALRASGHEVVALDRSRIGEIAAARDWAAHLAGAHAVVHLAALAHARGIDEERLRAVNVGASATIGRAAAAAGMRMIFMSSAKVFGEETRDLAFDERSPLAPQDAYARAKADAERALRAIEGLRLTVLRPPLVYGPGVRANFLALMRALARGWPLPLASLDNRRSLVGAGNLADAVVRCVEAPLAAGRTYCVTDGAPVSTSVLCRAIAAALGREARLFAFPAALLELVPAAHRLTRSFVLDDGALRSELGWTPPRKFEAELRLAADWFRGQGG